MKYVTKNNLLDIIFIRDNEASITWRYFFFNLNFQQVVKILKPTNEVFIENLKTPSAWVEQWIRLWRHRWEVSAPPMIFLVTPKQFSCILRENQRVKSKFDADLVRFFHGKKLEFIFISGDFKSCFFMRVNIYFVFILGVDW